MAHYLAAVLAAAAAAVGLTFVPRAFAHHVMGGELPGTAWQGLLSGLGHPIIGMDHLAFIIGVGIISHLVGRIVLLPLLFVGGTLLGCFMHVQSHGIPWSEPAIVLTIAVAAAIVGTHARIPTGILAILFVVAGALHGYAYGESIVGAEAAPLGAYIVGFAVVQYGLALGSGAALRIIVGRDHLRETIAVRMAGAGMALVAALAFVNIALVG
jgi:urease accessory protein